MSQSLSVPEGSHPPKSRNHRDAPVGLVRSRTDMSIGKRLFVTFALCIPLASLRLRADPKVVRWVQGRFLRIIVSHLRLDLASHNCTLRSFARGIIDGGIILRWVPWIRFLVC